MTRAISVQRPLLAVFLCIAAGCAKTPPASTPPKTPLQNEPAASAATEPVQPTEPPIARVLGREILSSELDPPSDSSVLPQGGWSPKQLREYRFTTLYARIWQPLLDRYAAQHDVKPTNDEIESYWEAVGKNAEQESESSFLEDLRKDVANPDLAEKDRQYSAELLTFLEQHGEGSQNDRLIAFLRKKLESPELEKAERNIMEEELEVMGKFSLRKMAEHVVRKWKLDKALHAQYGGRVIFQQMNPTEPVGAYRKFLEEREKNGDFEILDPELRKKFWRYFLENDSGVITADDSEHAFDQPWWLQTEE